MRRECRGCRKHILSHTWVVASRDFCSPSCQRDFDVDPNERVRRWNDKKQKWYVVPARWYDSHQR